MDEILGEGSLVCKNGSPTPVLWEKQNKRDAAIIIQEYFLRIFILVLPFCVTLRVVEIC